MSDPHIEEHSTWIKTPTQLIVVVVLAFVIPIAVILLLVQLVVDKKDYSQNNPAMSEEAVAKRLKPVGDIVITSASGGSKAEKSGKEVVEAVCAACHATGALNAPKIGDKAAWAKLIQEGLDVISADAIKGIRQMPARGGNPDLTDIEVTRAVVYMANQSGANWKEPESKPAAPAPTAVAPAPAAAAAAPASAATPPAAGAGNGKSVYDKACAACHASGVAGAPKAGDKAAWAPRLKGGNDALYATALKGKGAMPPKGGNMALADADVKAAVDYMVSLAK